MEGEEREGWRREGGRGLRGVAEEEWSKKGLSPY